MELIYQTHRENTENPAGRWWTTSKRVTKFVFSCLESDDWGTPTPGRLALDRTYTYHNSDQILMESIPARSVKSLVVHNLNQLSINIEPQKSESCTPKQTNAIIESAPPHEEVKDAESSLNESDFDNYESISDDGNSLFII